MDTDAGAFVAFVRERGYAGGGGLVQGAEAVGAGGGQVRDDLHVAALVAVFAGVPQVIPDAGIAFDDPVGVDQCRVQAQVRPLFACGLVEDVVQVRGLVGDHVDRLVEVPVGGGDRESGFGG
ncbi:hypothetical protein KV203_10945 [Skermania piniformis]|uniref:Uncharacterized protein n=1 Tax=Skermania pinensis TaxID=39122 RepID=A0ABX8S7F5_9ACTN|nr:hypothetical protein KV203_10945 [Skermania piniformis]